MYETVPPLPRSTLAVASLVLGLLSLPCSIATGIPAIITGHRALSAINRSSRALRGRVMALAGLALGYASVALFVGVLIVLQFSPRAIVMARSLFYPPNHEIVIRVSCADSRVAPDLLLVQTTAVLKIRLQVAGVAGEIRPSPPDQVVVRFAAKDADVLGRTKDLMLAQGELSFHVVHQESGDLASRMHEPGFTAPAGYRPVVAAGVGSTAPETVFIQDESVITGRDVRRAWVASDAYDMPAVNVTFTQSGAAIMSAATRENIGKRMAIVFDGRIISMPRITSLISEEAQINGNFTLSECKDLVTVLNSGSLPCPIIILTERSLRGRS